MFKRYVALLLGIICFLGMFQQNDCLLKAETGYNLKNPQTKEDGSSVWDCIYFGRYWQNDTNKDGIADKKDDKEPIKWRVLQINGDDAFLLSDQVLDVQIYHESYQAIQWKDCTLRQWLNQEFFMNAFDKEEQEAVIESDVKNGEYINEEIGVSEDTKDKVYLLSKSEISDTKLGFAQVTTKIIEDRKWNIYQNRYVNVAECSPFAIACGVSNTKGKGDWWLRSIESRGSADAVAYTGFRTGQFVSGAVSLCSGKRRPDFGVRPVIHLDLSQKKLWEAAGEAIAAESKIKQDSVTGYSNTEENEKKSPTIAKGIVKKPEKIKSLSLKNNKGKKITVRWGKIKGAKGYQIQYALSQKGLSKGKRKNIKKTSITISKLKKKKTYYVRARAYKLVAKRKVYGKWSVVKKIKIRR